MCYILGVEKRDIMEKKGNKKIMGITCKPVGKLRGTLRRIQNEKDKEQQAKNRSKSKENKEN